MRTTGISCGICNGLSEIYFRRLPGVDKVKISLRNEAILLTYKPGATVDPEAIRKVLEPLKVGVVQFQVSLRGEIRETGGKQILQAGKDRFLVRDTIDTPVLPLNTHRGDLFRSRHTERSESPGLQTGAVSRHRPPGRGTFWSAIVASYANAAIISAAWRTSAILTRSAVSIFV